ncbi:MAG TPA: NUDIX hydrolase [Trueperaceae bacterium]
MREVVFDGRIVRLELVDGRYEVVKHADSVAVLVTDGRRVLGVRQWRVAIETETWEIPAGLVDPGETPAQAAARELAEEVGLTGRLEPLTSCYASPGFTDERLWLFAAKDLREHRLPADDDEELTPAWRDALDVWRSVARGDEVSSASTLLGLAHLLGSRGELG